MARYPNPKQYIHHFKIFGSFQMLRDETKHGRKLPFRVAPANQILLTQTKQQSLNRVLCFSSLLSGLPFLIHVS
ncbi:hypothetical protein I79_003033 [Cricetulus griseus]|uniref:Uncharacterized protein n=1 Tax=Cricetulus griseus TaxID=10029 RepID=G3GYY3_CRIGR|nr:hypothetical protein I79_003033 [Cricetulus griseus]ERE72195.1 hypothetical protein H671_6g15309 [Cricetulus griseus]